MGGIRIDADTTHHVVARRTHFHGALSDVHVGEFLELVKHAGKFFLHILRRLVRDVEIRATMFSAAAFLYFGVDGAVYDIAPGKFHAFGVVPFHEALADFVAQDTSFTAHGFGAENRLHAGWPDHSGGMELYEFHVHEFGARFISQRHSVAGVLPGVGGSAPGFADATRGDDDGLRLEHDEAAVFTPIGKRPGGTATIRQKPRDRALH